MSNLLEEMVILVLFITWLAFRGGLEINFYFYRFCFLNVIFVGFISKFIKTLRKEKRKKRKKVLR